MASLMMG
jgi:1-phosphatidylinositol-4-phosphate 5-kinase